MTQSSQRTVCVLTRHLGLAKLWFLLYLADLIREVNEVDGVGVLVEHGRHLGVDHAGRHLGHLRHEHELGGHAVLLGRALLGAERRDVRHLLGEPRRSGLK